MRVVQIRHLCQSLRSLSDVLWSQLVEDLSYDLWGLLVEGLPDLLKLLAEDLSDDLWNLLVEDHFDDL